MTFAHTVSKLLPSGLAQRIKPRWHWAREASTLRFRQGGTLGRAREIGAWMATRPFGPEKRHMRVAVRAYKELRRFVQFGANPSDLVDRWLHEAKDCSVLYDVGSANGLEGFLANHLHACKVLFIEPSTPSIETILCTIHLQSALDGVDREKFEIVHAGCDERPGYSRAYYHEPPVAGTTYISFGHPEEYCRGGRADVPVYASQWIRGVSLDYLAYECDLPPPSHIKIDVDGFEDRVVRGAKRLLAEKIAKSWVIEVTGEPNLEFIHETMASSGYKKTAEYEHYPGYEFRTFDIVFDRQ